MTTLFTMTIDTEEEWDWDGGWPTRNLALSNIQRLPRFQEICARHGVACTYFVDQAVFDDTKARTVLLDIANEGRVEIGMHIHPWNTPPLDPAGPVRPRDTFVANLPRETALAKLQSVHECFARFGLSAPTSFRGGRYSSGGVVHEFLRDRGFLVDSSICPFSTWKDDGAPDYRAHGLEPNRLPPRFPDDKPLWEVPLTLAFTRQPFAFWQNWFNRIEHSWLSKLRLIGIAERLGVVRKAWLNFEAPQGKDMLGFLSFLRKLALPCIVFTVHSSSLLAGGNTFTRTQADEDRLFAQLEEVFGALAGMPEFQPATMTEVAKRLEDNYHACTRN